MAILYKCRLSNLQKGGRPCYQAIVQSSGTISRAEFIDELVRLSGNSPQVAEFFLNLMVAVLEHFYRQGKRIQLGSLAGGIAIRGSVSSPPSPRACHASDPVGEDHLFRLSPSTAAPRRSSTPPDGSGMAPTVTAPPYRLMSAPSKVNSTSPRRIGDKPFPAR